MKATVIGRAAGLMVLAFPWLGAQAGSAVSQRSGTPEALVAFVNVTVIPMDSPGALPNHTVLVEDGSITRVGPYGGHPGARRRPCD